MTIDYDGIIDSMESQASKDSKRIAEIEGHIHEAKQYDPRISIEMSHPNSTSMLGNMQLEGGDGGTTLSPVHPGIDCPANTEFIVIHDTRTNKRFVVGAITSNRCLNLDVNSYTGS